MLISKCNRVNLINLEHNAPIEPGSLVRSCYDKQTYGIVVSVDGLLCTVMWNDSGPYKSPSQQIAEEIDAEILRDMEVWAKQLKS